MRIETSQVSYAAAYRTANATTVIDETSSASRPARAATAGDRVQLSEAARSFDLSNLNDPNSMSPKDRLALLVLWAVFGHKISFRGFVPAVQAGAASAPAAAVEVRRRTELHYEMEQSSFQARGVVADSEGRRIEFSVELTMQREFESASTTVSSGATTDPLVLNPAGAAARLSSAKITFDLNSDGEAETISFVAGGSGFLALDKNGDGKVNDGRELFGPQTGNGFAELSAYDSDGSGWIDANDPVFGQLRIWTADGFFSLSEKGVGAIATASVETPFAIKDQANAVQGYVRGTGVYLSEDGVASTIQQVDLAQQ